jgi:hypothetical protein
MNKLKCFSTWAITRVITWQPLGNTVQGTIKKRFEAMEPSRHLPRFGLDEVRRRARQQRDCAGDSAAPPS